MSVAVHVTVVTPFGNVDPLAGAHTTVTGPQLSLAVVVNVATAVQTFGAVGRLMFAGQVIDGGTVSFTVTVKLQFDEFADESLTVHVTVVVPFVNVDPLAGVQEGVPTPGQLSLTAGAA